MIRNYSNGYGVNIDSTTFKTVLENVFCYNCSVGFDIGYPSNGFTSMTLINCWAAFCAHGYRLASGTYSSLINCASDNCQIGYELYGCNTIKLLNCGVEGATLVPVLLESCTDVVIDGLFATSSGDTSVYHSAVCTIRPGCDKCTIVNCVEHNPVGTYSVLDGSSGTNWIYNNDMRSINKLGTVTNDYHIDLTLNP